jgi:hypothetical protein
LPFELLLVGFGIIFTSQRPGERRDKYLLSALLCKMGAEKAWSRQDLKFQQVTDRLALVTRVFAPYFVLDNPNVVHTT